MTLQTAFELGQFAYRLKDHGADSLYEDFVKIVEKLMNEPGNWNIWPETMKPNPNDPLKPWDVNWSTRESDETVSAQL